MNIAILPIEETELFMIEGYISIKEAADQWNITPRRVQMFCVEGRIQGAAKLGREWAIPVDSEKPNDKRVISGKYRNWRSTGKIDT